MSIFPQEMINEVLDALDIQPILLKINYRPEMIQDAGKQVKCFCPIHKETIFRTLTLDKTTKRYQCSNYNCPGNAGGDLVDLVAKALGQSYEQAMLELAEQFGIEIDMESAESFLIHSLEVARNYLELGVLEDAEKQLDQIVRFRPDCIEALEGLERIYEQTNRPELFQSTRLKLATVLLNKQRTQDALAILKIYVRDNPEDFQTRKLFINTLEHMNQAGLAAQESLTLGDRLAARGEIDLALESYRAVQRMNPEGVNVSEKIVDLLTRAGRREEAIAEKIAQAEGLINDADLEGALATLEAALELDPSRDAICVQMAKLAARIGHEGESLEKVCRQVQRLLSIQAHGPAAQTLEELERAFPNNPRLMVLRAGLEDARGNTSQALDLRLHCIDLHHQRHHLEQALEVLESTLKSRPENVALLSRKANLLREKGELDDALAVYHQIINLFRNAEEYENAAAVYQTLIDLEPGKIEHREAQFELYLQQGTEPIIAQKAIELANAYKAENMTAKAAEMLSRAIGRAALSSELLGAHGQVLQTCGRNAEAAEQYLAQGRLLAEQNHLDRARTALETALRCLPEHLEARECLADVQARQEAPLQAMSTYNDLIEFYLREGDGEGVVRNARKVLEVQSEHLPSLLALAKGYGLLGQETEQLQTQTKLVDIYLKGQSYTRATEICEQILNRNENYIPALEQLVSIAEATRRPSQSVQYLWKLSQVHARASRRDEEQAILQELLTKEPMHTAANYRLIELLMLWGTPEALGSGIKQMLDRFELHNEEREAIAILKDLCQTSTPKPEIFSGLARLHGRLGETQAQVDALSTQAELLGRLLRDAEALEVWQQLSLLQPGELTILRTRIEIMRRNQMHRELITEQHRLAQALTEQGRYEEAEMALIEVLNHEPDDQAARDALISIFIRTRDFTRAAEQIEEAASHLIEEGQPTQAIAVLERIFEFDTGRIETHRKIIAIQNRSGDVKGAMASYWRLLDSLEEKGDDVEMEQAAQEALMLDPAAWNIRERLANFYRFKGRRDEAESTLLTLAVHQIEAKAFDLAEKTLDQLLEINPNSVPARAHRAQLLAQQGQADQALSAFLSLTGALSNLNLAAPGMAGPGDTQTPFRNSHYEGIKLLPEYTFDSFIVGSRNNFAHATAMAVSRAPAKNYNPLFLYSDVGLGKTHLCHAIVHYIMDHHPQMKILYTTTEDFVAGLIDAIQTNGMGFFRNRHKLTDVFLIDDVQFLSGKERAQEEFFHIFNAIHQAGKQIVLTSDRPPKDISHLEKRLRSRFGAGIIVDIQSPDLETRIAILRHELEKRGRKDVLSDEMIHYIAHQIDSNVRELKGVLNQVVARQEFSETPLHPADVQHILERNYTEAGE